MSVHSPDAAIAAVVRDATQLAAEMSSPVSTPRDLHAEAELRLGRQLTGGERYIDIAGIDRTLEQAKETLVGLIEERKRSAIRGWLEQNSGWWDRLRVTGPIADELVGLHDAGAEFARAEMRAMGVEPRRAFASAESRRPNLEPVVQHLTAHLNWMGVRLDAEAAHVTFAHPDASRDDLIDAIDKAVPGARDAVSRVLTPAMYGGLGEVYEQNEDLFREGWTYSAVMDATTCDVCEAFDGEEFPSWEAIQAVLPGGGPNPECLGGMRCRCRAVPNEIDTSELAAEDTVDSTLPSDTMLVSGGVRGDPALRRAGAEDALRELDQLLALPGRANLPADGLPLTLRKTSSARGHFKYADYRGPIEINISTTDQASATMAHEYGHLIDRAYLGGSDDQFATMYRLGTDEQKAAMDELLAATRASRAYATLELRRDAYGRYMRDPRELFARSFAQWAGEQAGEGSQLRREVRARVEAERETRARLGDVEGWREYPEWWDDDDFAPIAAAVEKVLRANGLLRDASRRPPR